MARSMELMGWSDDTRCLHCDGKLPLYRKITNGQFCSAAHRRAYWQEQERLAVERLSQTHDSLLAYRPPGSDAILGITPASPLSAASQLPEDPVVEFARTVSNHDHVTLAEFLDEGHPQAADWISGVPATAEPVPFAIAAPVIAATPGPDAAGLFDAAVAGMLELSLAAAPADSEQRHADAEPLESASQHLLPAAQLSAASEEILVPDAPAHAAAVAMTPLAVATAGIEPAVIEAVAIPLAAAAAPAIPRSEIAPVAIDPLPIETFETEPAAAAPVEVPDVEATPAGIAVEPLRAELEAEPATEEPAPPMASAVAAAKFEAGSFRFTLAPTEVAPVENELARPALVAVVEKPSETLTPAAGEIVAMAEPHAADSAAALARPAVEALDAPVARPALELSPEKGSHNGLATPAAGAELPRGNAARYLLSNDCPPLPKTEMAAPETFAPQAAVPALRSDATPLAAPAFAWLKKLPIKRGTPAAAEAAKASGMLPAVYPEGFEPRLPAYNFEVADGSEVPPLPRSFLAFVNWTPGDGSAAGAAWTHVAGFWNHAPRDLKLLLFAIPVLLTLALHPGLPKVRVTAPSAGASFSQAIATRLNAVQRNVANRAGVALAEDFRSGLEDWQTRGDLSAAWSFDANGFVRPASLALYRPSMGLSDYEMQFLGLIDKKALSFVARAQDWDNYYVVKLVVLKPGPLPTIGVTRYAVINGKAQNRVDSVAPVTALPDMLYRVSLDVHGDTYLLSLQGRVLDSWSEPRLPRGGVGFFAPRGEESRLRWVQVTHQYDMLGRLCAYLAPYNSSNTNGSW